MNLDLLRIPTGENDVAVLRYEARRPRGITIVAGHGYSSSKHNLDFLCAFLAAHGCTVWSLDFPGHKLGASGGRLRGIDDCVAAMRAVVDAAWDRDGGTLYTMGHSMGAMTAVFTAAVDERPAGAIAIATGYGRPTALETLRRAGTTSFRSEYVVGVTLPELVRDADVRFDTFLPRLAGKHSLYIAASRDAMVHPRSVRELYERAPHEKSFATIESDHTYAAEHARAAVLQWLDERHPRG